MKNNKSVRIERCQDTCESIVGQSGEVHVGRADKNVDLAYLTKQESRIGTENGLLPDSAGPLAHPMIIRVRWLSPASFLSVVLSDLPTP